MFIPRTDDYDFAVSVELLKARARNPLCVYRVIRDAVAVHRAKHAEEFYRYRFASK